MTACCVIVSYNYLSPGVARSDVALKYFK